jgi:hypothetical protein
MEEADGRFNLRETQARVSVPVRRVLYVCSTRSLHR